MTNALFFTAFFSIILFFVVFFGLAGLLNQNAHKRHGFIYRCLGKIARYYGYYLMSDDDLEDIVSIPLSIDKNGTTNAIQDRTLEHMEIFYCTQVLKLSNEEIIKRKISEAKDDRKSIFDNMTEKDI